MLNGFIKIPVADLRAKSEAGSERITQALFGTPIQIRTVQKKFSKIALPDGCVGWCRTGHIHQVAFAPWKKYIEKPKSKIRFLSARVYDFSGKTKEPFILHFGTVLLAKKDRGRVPFSLPGGMEGLVSGAALWTPPLKRVRGVGGRQIITIAKKFLGTPYLWGGITPYGLDCSGLVQTVFGYYDIRMPRNSGDQAGEGFKVDRNNLKAGDLLFFPGHVAISLGGLKFIHASASRGMVVIESLDSNEEDYRRDLDNEFTGARRIPL